MILSSLKEYTGIWKVCLKMGFKSFKITRVLSVYLFSFTLFKDTLMNGSHNPLKSFLGKFIHLSIYKCTYFLLLIKGGWTGKTKFGWFIAKVNLTPLRFFSPISSRAQLILCTSCANLNLPFISFLYNIISNFSSCCGRNNKLNVSINKLSVVTFEYCPL